MKVWQHLAIGLALALFATGCAHNHSACHGSCACEYGNNCDCWRRGGCDCQMANTGTGHYVPATPANPQDQALPPSAPATEAASNDTAGNSSTAANEAAEELRSDSQEDLAWLEAPAAKLRKVAQTADEKTEGDRSSVVTPKSSPAGSQQISAQKRLSLLIARETATLAVPGELDRSATAEAMRLYPVDEPLLLPGTQTNDVFPPAPPLPMTLEELESAGETSLEEESASAETTNADSTPLASGSASSRELSEPKLDEADSSDQPQPFVPEANVAMNQQPLQPTPATTQPLPNTAVQSLANVPVVNTAGVPASNFVPQQPAPFQPQAQQPVPQYRPASNMPGRVRIRRYTPGTVNGFFYGW